MSDLIMTISDDDDDQQLQQPQTAARPQFLATAAQRTAARVQANRLTTNGTAAKSTAQSKKSFAQQLAEAERDDDAGEDGTADDDDDEEDFEMAAPAVKPAAKPAASKKAAHAKPQAQKRKAAAAQLDDDDDDDENDDELPASGAFEFDVEAASAPIESKTILPPSKIFQPYVQNNGTSLQHKINKQLEKSTAKKNAKAKSKKAAAADSDDDMASSSSDDENSEASDSDDDDEADEEGGDLDADSDADGADADEVDSDVDMTEYKDDSVTKKTFKDAPRKGPKVIQAKELPKPKYAIGDFASLRLSRPLLRAVAELGWQAPTPVQAASILPAVGGKDLLVNAVTGSGKTGAFMLPILERLMYRPKRVAQTRVLVLLPTRELASQCHEVSCQLARHTDIRICLIVGGLSEKVQEQELRAKPDVVLATPGRLIDHLRNTQNVHLEDVEILVLDEADRLLETGFAEELKEIIKETPKGRQTLLFSATLTETVIDLVNLSLNDPVRIKIDAYESIVDNLKQEFIRIRGTAGDKESEKEREAIILSLAKRSFKTKTIIFTQSKQQCHRMSIIFGLARLKSAELQGNMTQTQRLESLEAFRTGAVDFLMCTDLASRGLDIAGVETVLNMSMPRELRAYIHRVGRTARAGRAGRAVTLVGEGQRAALKELVKKARDVVHSRVIPPEVIAKYRTLIREMEPDIRGIFAQEGEEKAIRVAEMEANKLTNTMRHRDEILARPAKTWFQTPAEKKAAKEAGVKLFGEDDEESTEKAKPLTPKQLRRLESQEKKAKDKNGLLGLSRAKKRRKLMQLADEKAAKDAAREAAKHGPNDLRTQAMPQESKLPPLSLAAQEKMQRALGKKAKKDSRREKLDELGIADVRERRREHQAMQLMAAEKKKGKHVYNDGDDKPAARSASADSTPKPPKTTTISGSHFRYKERTGSGDDRYKLPHRKFKEEQALRKKGESTAKPPESSKKKSLKKGSFKSQAKFKRR